MAKQSLYREHRPSLFKEVVGQKTQKKNLHNLLKNDALNQAILFSGPSGVGKTTLARIVAKVINCKKPTPEWEPCNECDSCKDVKGEGFNRNIYMIDAATNRGVAQIEPIKAGINSYPILGDQYKIFIFDEAHKLTDTVFNSFLTVLEEPPEYMYFMFCTTEPQNVLNTIKTRCLPVKCSALKDEEVASGLAQVLDTHLKRRITRVEMFVCKKIADVSFGCMRDSLTTLQTLIYNDALTVEKAEEFVPKFDQTTLAKCIEWVFSKNGKIVEYIDTLDESKDFDAFFLQMRRVIKNTTYAKLGLEVVGPPWLQNASKMNADKITKEEIRFLLETFNTDTTRIFQPKEFFFNKFSNYLLK